MFNDHHVIIIGAGIGGLSAAAAISPHVKKVSIVDKDCLPEIAASRKAVPQGAHISILLKAGLDNLEALMPGMTEQLIASGAAQIRAGIDQRIHEFGEWTPERDLAMTFIASSRPFLEQSIKEQVLALSNVILHQETAVDQLLCDGTSIQGLRFKNDTDLSLEEPFLVIDAAGNSAPFVRQINKTLADKDQVQTDTVDTGIFYSTVHFERPEEWSDACENLLLIPDSEESDIGGSLLSIENNQWCVSLHGRNSAKPPQDMDTWMAFAQQLPDPCIWERVKDAKITQALKNFRKPTSTWRRFDLATRLPDRYLPIGDTFTSFNPIFGQGMTVALGHALALKETLENASPEMSFAEIQRSYIKGASTWSQKAWKRATSYDASFSKKADTDPRKLEFLKALTKQSRKKMMSEPEAHRKVVEQSQMLI